MEKHPVNAPRTTIQIIDMGTRDRQHSEMGGLEPQSEIVTNDQIADDVAYAIAILGISACAEIGDSALTGSDTLSSPASSLVFLPQMFQEARPTSLLVISLNSVLGARVRVTA